VVKSEFPSILIEGLNHRDSLHEMAAHLLCESQIKCGRCLSCRWVNKSQHPDWIQAEGSLKMEELRSLLYDFRLKPSQSKERVLSILDFQDASAAVQNALLKTLEEPLQDRRILLGVTHAKAVLPTIQSRCLRLMAQNEVLSEKENEWTPLFEAVASNFELDLNRLLDPILKNRDEAQKAFRELALLAAQKSWPGRWRKLAPYWDEAREALDRNLNPRIVWDQLLEHQHS
jgi:hypothetical protein